MNIDGDDKMVVLNVQRGKGDGPSRVERYELPVGAAASLLDGLRWVRQHIDDSLAFRYSCINANACKECLVVLDGKVVYACMARITDAGHYQVDPLPNKARLLDLVTQIAPVKERLASDQPDKRVVGSDDEARS